MSTTHEPIDPTMVLIWLVIVGSLATLWGFVGWVLWGVLGG